MPVYVTFGRFVVKIGCLGEDDLTSYLFYDMAVDKVARSQGHVVVPEISDKYYFIRRSDLLNAERFERFQNIRHNLVYMQPDATCLFVSRDWQLPDLPDPYNHQFDELVRLLSGDEIAFQSQQMQCYFGMRTFLSFAPLQASSISPAEFEYIWYDYCCMPQLPRDHDEGVVFLEQLTNLNNIFASEIRTVQVGDTARQKTRAWCVMKQEIAKKNKGTSMASEGELPHLGWGIDEGDQVFGRVRMSLEGTNTTDPHDHKIVEWMLYKSFGNALVQEKRHDSASPVPDDRFNQEHNHRRYGRRPFRNFRHLLQRMLRR